MKRLALASAFALVMAPVADAQWEFKLSNTVLSPANPSTVVTLSVEPTPGDYAFGNADLDVHADEAGWSGPEALIRQPGQVPGTILGHSVIGIRPAQGIGFSFPPDPGRIEAWRAIFTVTDFSPRQIDVRTETSLFQVITSPVFPYPREPRMPIEGQAIIRVIPAPGAIALLASGTLPAIRRQRCLPGPLATTHTRP